MHLNKVVSYWLTLLGDHSYGLYIFRLQRLGSYMNVLCLRRVDRDLGKEFKGGGTKEAMFSQGEAE